MDLRTSHPVPCILSRMVLARGQCKLWKIFCKSARNLARILIWLCFVSVVPPSVMIYLHLQSFWMAECIRQIYQLCQSPRSLQMETSTLNCNSDKTSRRCNMIKQQPSSHFVCCSQKIAFKSSIQLVVPGLPGIVQHEWMCIYIPHISHSVSRRFTILLEWDRTSACKGASGCRYQSIFDLTHSPNPCMKCTMKQWNYR